MDAIASEIRRSDICVDKVCVIARLRGDEPPAKHVFQVHLLLHGINTCLRKLFVIRGSRPACTDRSNHFAIFDDRQAALLDSNFPVPCQRRR